MQKDEGLNPTGSFKARGMSAAVTRAKQLGAKALAAPTAGNAGGARWRLTGGGGGKFPCCVEIVMPADTPSANVMECQAFGAKVVKLNGLISDCGKYVAERKDREGWYDVSTLKEPYRVEGKKTMGYELWEQFEGKLPDVILYPTGGGVGLIGMCKAFDEMQEMGWIGTQRPRMVAVQAEGCAPIVKAWEAHRDAAEFFPNAATIASGLRVPGPLGDRMMLRMLRQTNGTALTVSDAEMLQAGRELASLEGIYAAPEGACDRDRCAQARRLRLDQAGGNSGALQYRHWLQVCGSVAARAPGLAWQRVDSITTILTSATSARRC